MLPNLTIADRLAPTFRPVGPDDELVQRFREIVGTHAGLVRCRGRPSSPSSPASARSQWNNWILFTTASTSATTDPRSTTTSASTCSSCRSWRSSPAGCSPRCRDPGGHRRWRTTSTAASRSRRPLRAGSAPGQGAPVGAARRARPGEGAVLASALPAGVLDAGHGRRCHLHRRQRAAEGHLPAGADLAVRLRPVHRQHLAAGLGAAGAGRGAVGVRGHRGRWRSRRSCSGCGCSRPSRRWSGPTSSTTSTPPERRTG